MSQPQKITDEALEAWCAYHPPDIGTAEYDHYVHLKIRHAFLSGWKAREDSINDEVAAVIKNSKSKEFPDYFWRDECPQNLGDIDGPFETGKEL